jgi:hypothetical protein
MCIERRTPVQKREGWNFHVSTCSVVFALLIVSCVGTAERIPDFSDGIFDHRALAVRFAPRLYLHEDEPYRLEAVVPVLHPSRPIIAYHIFFEFEVLFVRGEKTDHEIVWVAFDPVTLKVRDVFTYWHRTVLRTDECVHDARSAGQRPRVDVQWGQHGMLPFGWSRLNTIRPRAELVMYYGLVRYMRRSGRDEGERRVRSFSGSYDDYVRFDTYIDTVRYLEGERMIVAENPSETLRSRIPGEFAEKKEWPDW